ncbi:MAG: hypothetical protein JST22_20155 [Bacteroidetes bacterium]|nr:hypothetical protein [Bacteroidota bacterium]
MGIRSTLAIMLGLVLASPLLVAQGFDRDRTVGDGPGTAQQIAAKVAVAPDGTVYVIWADSRSGSSQVFLASSKDHGQTFSASRQITNANGLQAGAQRGPQLAIDRNGILHMTVEVKNELNKITVRYMRSADGGATFSAPLAIAADSGLHNQDFPSIAVDSSGNPCVCWIDSRDAENGMAQHPQLYVVRSANGGTSFMAPVRATNIPDAGTCECCNTSIAASANGNIFASFRSNINNNRDVHIARSLDGGSTFSVMKAASESWQIDGCPMTGSSIAVDRNETAYVTWRDSRPSARGKDYIYYTTLRRGDTACARDRRICNTPSQSNYPSIGIAPDGGILCAFQDNRTDAADIYYTYSPDGLVFSPEAKLTHESGSSRQELPSVAIASDGTRYIVWQDSRQGQPHIMLGRDQSAVSAAPAADAEGAKLELGELRPNPVGPGRMAAVDFSLPSDGTAEISLYDITGCESAVAFNGSLTKGSHSIPIDMAGLARGTYFCVLRFGGRRLTRPVVLQN